MGSALRRLGVLGFLVALLGYVGPPASIHHGLHRLHLEPVFRKCCCANEDHTSCGWNDHYRHAWRHGHPGVMKSFWILGGVSLLMLAAGVVPWKASGCGVAEGSRRCEPTRR